MKILLRRYYRKVYGGAVMFQVLLGLGLMVLMSPMVFTQIKKYNEQIQREEVIADLDDLRKAATSFIMFEKNAITSGCKIWDTSSLSGYLNSATHKNNVFGQTYGMVTCRSDNSDQVESVVVAYGPVEPIVLNSIGQYLFDKGGIMADDKNILGDAKLSSRLTTKLKTLVNGYGLLFMYVTDAFFDDDYLHISKMEGTSDRATLVNTMLTNLNMGGKSIRGVGSFYIIDDLSMANNSTVKIDTLTVSDLSLMSETTVNQILDYANKTGLSSGGSDFPVQYDNSGEFFETKAFDNLTFDQAKFKKVYLKDSELCVGSSSNNCRGNMDVSNYYVHGNADLTNNSVVNVVYANVFTTTQVSSSVNVVGSIVMDKPSVVGGKNEESYIYIEKDNEDPTSLNFAGVSEVKDICYNNGTSDCLSNEIYNLYQRMNTYYGCYPGCKERGECNCE